jgi:hypothetical protein
MAEERQETAPPSSPAAHRGRDSGSDRTQGSRGLIRESDGRRWRFASAEAAARHLGSATG